MVGKIRYPTRYGWIKEFIKQKWSSGLFWAVWVAEKKKLQKVFWPKKNLNSMHRFKSAILAIFQFWQNGTFETVHEIWKFFWSKDFFWSFMKMKLTKNIPNMSQGLPNPGFRSVRVKKLKFSQKRHTRFKKFFSIWVPVNTLQDWRGKLESAFSLMVYYCRNTVWQSKRKALSLKYWESKVF